jgi:hypothetical protein
MSLTRHYLKKGAVMNLKKDSVSMEKGGDMNLPLQIGHPRRGVRRVNAKNANSAETRKVLNTLTNAPTKKGKSVHKEKEMMVAFSFHREVF